MAKAKVTFADLATGPSRLRRKKITIGEWGGGTFYLLEISGTTHRDLIGKIEEIKGDDSLLNLSCFFRILTINQMYMHSQKKVISNQ